MPVSRTWRMPSGTLFLLLPQQALPEFFTRGPTAPWLARPPGQWPCENYSRATVYTILYNRTMIFKAALSAKRMYEQCWLYLKLYDQNTYLALAT